MPVMTFTIRDTIRAQVERIEDAIDREELKPIPDAGFIANARAQIAQLEDRIKILDGER